MKSFKEYLAESKRTFAFRVKVADCDLDSDTLDKIERSLSEFRLANMTKPKSLPITHSNEFHTLGPVGVKMFDINTDYPAIPPQVQSAIHRATGIPLVNIFVTNPTLNNDISDWDKPTGEALLDDPELTQDDADAQERVGLKRIDSLLKELSKDRHETEQVKGHNDEILAKSAPKEKAAKTSADAPQNNKSPVKPNTSPRGK